MNKDVAEFLFYLMRVLDYKPSLKRNVDTYQLLERFRQDSIIAVEYWVKTHRNLQKSKEREA